MNDVLSQRVSRRSALRGALVASAAMGSALLAGCSAKLPWQSSQSTSVTPIQRSGTNLAIWSVDGPSIAATKAPWQAWLGQTVASSSGGQQAGFTVFASGKSLINALILNVAAGQPPDAVIGTPAEIQAWAVAGTILPLSQYATSTSGASPDRFLPQLMSNAMVGNDTYAIPQPGIDFDALLVNLVPVRAAKPPKSNALAGNDLAMWGWSDFASWMSTMRKAEAQPTWPPFLNGALDLRTFAAWLQADAGDFLTPDRTSTTLGSARSVDTLNYLITTAKAMATPQPVPATGQVQALVSGDLAILFGRATQLSDVLTLAKGRPLFVDTLPILGGPGSDRSVVLSWTPGVCEPCMRQSGYASYGGSTNVTGAFGAIPRGAPHVDGSWAFVAAAGSSSAAERAALDLSLPGPQVDFFSSSSWKTMMTKHIAYTSWPDIVRGGGSFPGRSYNDLDPIVSKALADVYAGSASPQAALDAAASQAASVLAGTK